MWVVGVEENYRQTDRTKPLRGKEGVINKAGEAGKGQIIQKLVGQIRKFNLGSDMIG